MAPAPGPWLCTRGTRWSGSGWPGFSSASVSTLTLTSGLRLVSTVMWTYAVSQQRIKILFPLLVTKYFQSFEKKFSKNLSNLKPLLKVTVTVTLKRGPKTHIYLQYCKLVRKRKLINMHPLYYTTFPCRGEPRTKVLAVGPPDPSPGGVGGSVHHRWSLPCQHCD